MVKIVDEREKVELSRLEAKDWFEWEKNLYIKGDCVVHNDVQVINLNSGKTFPMESSTMVFKIAKGTLIEYS